VDFQQLFERLKNAGVALSAKQIVTLAIAFVAVVGLVVGTAYWVNAPNYTVLFSEMDPESASSVVGKLKAAKITYTVDDGGRTIRVPSEHVDELRLDMAGQGLPTSGRIGFEIFDRTAFGVTDFLEHVNYRRALEGELARTISTISEVASARVHLAMPKPSVFAGQDQSAKASVVLKLRTNNRLAASTVNAVAGLVAAGVEGLKPESVVIIDTFGRPLARAAENGDETTGGLQLEREQRIEHDIAARVISLIDPVVGAERARVNVAAKLNPDSQEETEERWDPTPIVRSRQSVQQGGGVPTVAPSVAGARANLPEPPAKASAPQVASAPAATPTPVAVAASTNSSETTNYEVSKLTRHRIQPRGQIARLSVAVVLDDDHVVEKDKDGRTTHTAKPRSAADIQKIHDLVAAAVGLDSERGDQLTVENIAFEETPSDEPAPSSFWQRNSRQVMDWSRLVVILVVGAFALFGVIRPLIRQSFPLLPVVATSAGPALPQTLPRTVQDLEGELDAHLQAVTDQNAKPRRLAALTRHVGNVSQKEPENAARLLRTWLSEDER
jgi:flagellar M-ring protein FliF